MTAEDLIKILQAVNPETEVFVSLGDDDETKQETIKAEQDYDTLHVKSVEIIKDEWNDGKEAMIAFLGVRKYLK